MSFDSCASFEPSSLTCREEIAGIDLACAPGSNGVDCLSVPVSERRASRALLGGGPARATHPTCLSEPRVKGLGDAKGMAQADVTSVIWRSHHGCCDLQPEQQQQMSRACQTGGGEKGPLKGKGEALRQWNQLASDRMAEVHQAMQQLHIVTRVAALPDERGTASVTPFYLDVHTISSRGAKSLRWRLRGGKHATWDKIEPMLAHLPPAVAQTYREYNEEATILNAREQVARYEIKTARKLAEDIKGFRQR